jgi:hypothetical protein
MVRIDLDFQEWCEKCCRLTWHRDQLERVAGPESPLKLRSYCQKCGRMKREIPFNWPHLLF